MSVTVLSDADEVAQGLSALTSSDATVKSRIRSAASLLGWSISRVHEAWYRRAVIKPNELNSIRACIAKQRKAHEGIPHGINQRVLDRLAVIEEQNKTLLALLSRDIALSDGARSHARMHLASGDGDSGSADVQPPDGKGFV